MIIKKIYLQLVVIIFVIMNFSQIFLKKIDFFHESDLKNIT